MNIFLLMVELGSVHNGFFFSHGNVCFLACLNLFCCILIGYHGDWLYGLIFMVACNTLMLILNQNSEKNEIHTLLCQKWSTVDYKSYYIYTHIYLCTSCAML